MRDSWLGVPVPVYRTAIRSNLGFHNQPLSSISSAILGLMTSFCPSTFHVWPGDHSLSSLKWSFSPGFHPVSILPTDYSSPCLSAHIVGLSWPSDKSLRIMRDHQLLSTLIAILGLANNASYLWRFSRSGYQSVYVTSKYWLADQPMSPCRLYAPCLAC